MPTREEIDLKERAEKAMRAGQALEALSLYQVLLTHVQVFAPGVYDGWLEGAFGAYQALGRRREAAYVLLALRRFADAERLLSTLDCPVEWSLAASKQGLYTEAARALANAGHPVLAAVELEKGGRTMAARAEWERALADPRLLGRPYETALVHFNLGECLLKLGDPEAAGRAFTVAGRQLEEVADAFETRGNRERAFDCYSVLLRMGQDAGSFENVCEGYVNAIRILKAGTRSSTCCSTTRTFWATRSSGASCTPPPPWRARRPTSARRRGWSTTSTIWRARPRYGRTRRAPMRRQGARRT